MSHATLWLLTGFAMLAIEVLAFGVTSGLLLFGSLGALLTGILLWLGLISDSIVVAVGCFAVATSLITILLWKPLRRLQSGSELGNDRSSDLIGHRFVIDSAVSRQTPGSQKYSGIAWRVEPADVIADQTLTAGTAVVVTAVSVGVFYVEPQPPQS